LAKTLRTVIIDTYALMAKATGEIPPQANKHLEDVRNGKLKGVIHPLITYEFVLQFHKGRIPIFDTAQETLDFLETYFSTAELSNNTALTAAEIRFKSAALLTTLKRKLAICDSLTIALAKRTKAPIVTGDIDLRAVAEKENVEIIWQTTNDTTGSFKVRPESSNID
jgi:predicted nucleic acid-binding protein